MKLLIIALMLFSLLAISSGNPTNAPLPFPVGQMQFIGSIGGHNVTLNGTIQSVYAQAKLLHPDIDIAAECKWTRPAHRQMNEIWEIDLVRLLAMLNAKLKPHIDIF